jgi:hypothetical protein
MGTSAEREPMRCSSPSSNACASDTDRSLANAAPGAARTGGEAVRQPSTGRRCWELWWSLRSLAPGSEVGTSPQRPPGPVPNDGTGPGLCAALLLLVHQAGRPGRPPRCRAMAYVSRSANQIRRNSSALKSRSVSIMIFTSLAHRYPNYRKVASKTMTFYPLLLSPQTSRVPPASRRRNRPSGDRAAGGQRSAQAPARGVAEESPGIEGVGRCPANIDPEGRGPLSSQLSAAALRAHEARRTEHGAGERRDGLPPPQLRASCFALRAPRRGRGCRRWIVPTSAGRAMRSRRRR